MKRMGNAARRACGIAVLFLTLGTAGCLQLEMAIRMDDEGGARVTERLRLSKVLLDISSGMPEGRDISEHLKRPSVLDRMKQMGKGITLVSHEERDLPAGARESVAVFHIPDIEDLRVPNPFVQNHPPAPMHRLLFRPCYKSHRSGEVGTVSVGFVRAGPKSEAGKDGAKLPPAATPLDRQSYRALMSVVEDLARDFQVKVTLTVPNQPAGGRRPAGDRTLTLLSFDDKDMDRHAEPFLRNEEAMLALLQFKFRDPAILNHTEVFSRNAHVPVHRGSKAPYHSDSFRIHPTRHLFKKYYAGRPKAEGGDQ